jgi:hypothetical protein
LVATSAGDSPGLAVTRGAEAAFGVAEEGGVDEADVDESCLEEAEELRACAPAMCSGADVALTQVTEASPAESAIATATPAIRREPNLRTHPAVLPFSGS